MTVSMLQKYPRSSRALLAVALVAGLALIGLIVRQASAGIPLSVAGYQDFSYAALEGETNSDVTASKPESKLWWNDGFWWASMYNRDADEFHIYRLNWGTQDWEDTGVVLDTRRDTQADVLWDEAANKLYVVSHIQADVGSQVNTFPNWGHFFRYTYNEATQTYVQDPGFPVAVNEDKGEALVIDKDSTGRLWVTYVSRENSSSPFQVYVNVSTDDGDTWGTPFVIPHAGAEVVNDDISSVIAFEALGQGRIAVVWSNQKQPPAPAPAVPSEVYFAVHNDSESDPQAGWIVRRITPPGEADDHINVKSLNATDEGVFAAIKTSASDDADPGIGVVALDPSALTLSFHEYSTHANGDTQPILLIDEENEELYVFVTGKAGGSKICYKTLAIQTPLATMGDFIPGDCGTEFIEDAVLDNVDNATSTKQNINSTTGIVVLAANTTDTITDTTNLFYVHNVLGDPPPVVTDRTPGFDATDVLLDTTIMARFSKAMDASTINGSSFTVKDSGVPVAGTVSYDAVTRIATFTPAAPLSVNTTYTVELTDAIEDTSNQSLFGTDPIRDTWSFTTGTLASQPSVSVNPETYNVAEGAGVVNVVVELSAPSTQVVSVMYNTQDVTAVAGQDYTSVASTLTFAVSETAKSIPVTILNDALDESPLESFKLTLHTPTNATLGLLSEATVEIADNDAPPTVQFSTPNYSVTEAAGTATILVTLSAPSGQTVAVNYATSNGTATAPGDYTATAGTLEFAPGETSKSFTVTVKNDGVSGEVDETVNLTLSLPDDATLGSPSTATLTIVGDALKVYLPFVNRP